MDLNFPDFKFTPHIPDIEFPDPPEYEDTFFKDLADDIKQSQKETNDKIEILIQSEKESSSFNTKITIATLIVSILTLIATIAGIIINLI